MKELVNIENWGIRLYFIEPIDCDLLIEWRDAYKKGQYLFEYDDTYAPIEHKAYYHTLEEALSEIANYILVADNVYAMEEQTEDLQEAYKLCGIRNWTESPSKESKAAYTFIYLILEGIANANMRKEN